MHRRLAVRLVIAMVTIAAFVATAASTQAITSTSTTSTAPDTSTSTTSTSTSTAAAGKPDAPTKPAAPTKPDAVAPDDTKTTTTGTNATATTPATGSHRVPGTSPVADAQAAADDADAAIDGTAPASSPVDTGDSAIPVVDPTLPGAPGPPAVHALSWLVVDAGDGTELAGHAIATKRAIASLTKVMNAYLVVQQTRGNELVPIDRHALDSDGGSTLSMQVGQTYAVDDLLDATLVHSANDGAVAMAEYVGGGGAEGEAHFRDMMNATASKLGMADTRYTSVNGLDGLTGGDLPASKSTARDLVKLVTAAWKEPRFRHAVGLHEFTLERAGQESLTFPNRNTLLGSYPGVDGVKTGTTDQAGNCLITHYAGREGNYWVVVLGDRTEAARDRDSKALLDWARSLRPDVPIASAGDRIGEAPVDDGSTHSTTERLYLSSDLHARVRIGQHVTERLIVPSKLAAPLRAGDEVGQFQILAAGKVVAHSRVYVDRAASRTSRSARIRRLPYELPAAARLGVRTVHRQERRFMDFWGL